MGRRDTYATGAHSAQKDMRSGIILVARHLQNTVRKFLAERANAYDVEAAIDLWRDEMRKNEEANARLGSSRSRGERK